MEAYCLLYNPECNSGSGVLLCNILFDQKDKVMGSIDEMFADGMRDRMSLQSRL